MKLDLNTLFEMFQEIESENLQERETGLASSTDDTQELSPEIAINYIIPKVTVAELDVVVGADIVRNFVQKNMTGNSFLKKMQSLNLIATETKSGGIFKAGNSFEELVNRIAITEGIMAIFDNFEPTTAGNVNEQIVSLFYPNAEYKGTLEANKERDVSDFIEGNISYSLKTTSATSPRTQSAINTLNTLDNYKSIVSIDSEKIIENSKVVGFNISEENIDKTNLNEKMILITPKSNSKAVIQIAENNIENAQQILEAWESRSESNNKFSYLLVSEDDLGNEEYIEAKNIKQRENCFKSYRFKYKIGKQTAVEFQTETMRQQLQILVQSVSSNIVNVSKAMETIGKGLSQYFVSRGDEKKAIGQQMLDASKEVPIETKAITSTTK